MVRITRRARTFIIAQFTWLTFSYAVFAGQVPPSGQAAPSTQQVTLGWVASADPTVVGYYLYYGTTSGVYTNKINVGTNTTWTVAALAAGTTNYFTTTSYNASGIESGYVPEVSYLVPGILTLTQNVISGLTSIHFPVAPGSSYQVQASSDLITWSNLWSTPTETTNAWVEYDEPVSSTIPARFYRLILQ
jgi:hypothetical protein